MQIILPANYGGNRRYLGVRALNDTGSSIMTLYYHEAIQLGWQPALFPAQIAQISSPDGVSLREVIHVFAKVCDYNGYPLTDWFVEKVVLWTFTGAEARLSGSTVRNHLYCPETPESVRGTEQNSALTNSSQFQPTTSVSLKGCELFGSIL
jgi:hypothetical protein